MLIFSTLVVPAKAGADLGSPKEVELSTSLKPTIGSPVQPKGNLNEKGISKLYDNYQTRITGRKNLLF